MKLVILLMYLVTFGCLCFGYKEYIVPVFGYRGFDLYPNVFKISEGIIILSILSLCLPSFVRKPSDFFKHLHLLFPILPMFVLYGMRDLPREFFYITVLAFVLILFLSAIPIRVSQLRNVSPAVLERYLVGVILFVVASGTLMSGAQFIFDFNLVYEFRESVRTNLPWLFGYLIPLTSKVLIPFALILALKHKNWTTVAVLILAGAVLFSVTTHKSMLLIPLVVVMVYYVLASKNVIALFLAIYTFVVLLALVDPGSFEVNWLGSLGLRRTMLIPAHLNYLYFEYFSVYEFVAWSDSKLTFGLIDSPYLVSKAQLIGDSFYSGEVSANVGWLGSGYAQMGVVGMFVYGILISVFFSMLDFFALRHSTRFVIAVSFTSLFTIFTSTDLPAAFLTHGALLMLFILFLLQPSAQISGR